MNPSVLYVGAFDIAPLMAAADAGTAPSNHVHAMPDVRRLGLDVQTLAAPSAAELRGGWPLQRRIWREARAAQVVLAHSHYGVRGLALARRARLFRPRLAAFVHSMAERPWDAAWLRGFDLLLPISRRAESQLQALRLPCPVVYTPYGADLAFYRPPAVAPARDLVLSVGVSGRDYATLLDAAPQIAAPVHVVGRLAPGDAARAAGRVHVHSAGNYDLSFVALGELYARAACVVVVTHGSSHPYGLNGVVEAMAYGCPVVLTDGAGIDIDPAAGGFGSRVPAHDAAALAAAVNRVVGDAEAAQRMGAAARTAALAHANTAQMARVIAAALQALPGAAP